MRRGYLVRVGAVVVGVAGLLCAAGWGQAMEARHKPQESITFPADSGVVDVTKPPYAAVGDGRHDDTAAIQRALNDNTGRNTILYFPNGTYLVSASLRLPIQNPRGQTNWGRTHIQGQSQAGTILRLRNHTFTDPASPSALIDAGRHGSADWFHNDIRNLTLDTGSDNPGAIGLRFFSNNTGCVRDVTIRSSDGQGVIGLDLAYNDMNGPLLIQRVTVRGFDVGVRTGHTVNSQTFSHLTLQGQRRCGFRNEGQYLAIEGLVSSNSVPALENVSGLIALVGARLTGTGAATRVAAIINAADLYARDVDASGYAVSIGGTGAGSRSAKGPKVSEFTSSDPIELFPSSGHALRLPIKEAPAVPWDDPATWASPTRFGAEANQQQDAAPAIQAAIDSGATTVYIPSGTWRIGQTVHIRGRVRRVIGCEPTLVPIPPLTVGQTPMFRVDGGGGPIIIERMSTSFEGGPFYFVQQASSRPLILSSIAVNFQGADSYRATGSGPVFIENMVGGPFHFGKGQVWARQLNQESQGTHIENAGGSLWVLGLKTERGGTLIDTSAGGRTEVLGGLCYTTTAGKLAPMFVNRDSSVSVTIGERCYSGDPYTTIVRETRGAVTRELPSTDPRYNWRLVLYCGSRR